MTYVTDPIGDLLTRMRNAQKARRASCTAPWSRMKEELLTVLKKEGWIADVSVQGEVPSKEVEVTFSAEKPALQLSRVSKPGRRVYTNVADLRPVLHGFGTAVLTTSKGVITDAEARKQGIGGEVLCTIS